MVDLGGSSGFTLIEMMVVILVVGILTAVAMPQYARIMERPRAAEGVETLLAIKGAQDRHFSKYGAYCTGVLAGCLDIGLSQTSYFGAVPNAAVSGGGASWQLTLTRNVNTVYYGFYTLTYDAAAAVPLSCTPVPDCTNELLPMIQ